jgi:hypothetical protein
MSNFYDTHPALAWLALAALVALTAAVICAMPGAW